MTNPRLPFLAGGIAALAMAFASSRGWSDAAGFLFGWLALASVLIAQQIVPLAQREIAKFVRTYAERARLKVVARTRHGANAPSLDGIPPFRV